MMAALDASQLLGSQQIAGVKVNPRGRAKKVGGAAAGGAVGVLAGKLGGRIALGATDNSSHQTPQFGRLGYLAVTAEEVALLKTKSGLVSVTPSEVLVRVPRSEVASVDYGTGIVPPLHIEFSSGERWALEIPTPNRKDAQAVVDALGKPS
jgi:hypothetical protein